MEKVLVTGGTGFFGKHLVKLLRGTGFDVDGMGCEKDGDVNCTLLSCTDFSYIMKNKKYDYVFHLAGYNGGIKFNLENPFDIFQENTEMGLRVVEECAYWKVKKLVSIVTSCAYPKEDTDSIPFSSSVEFIDREICNEIDFLDGPIHETVACHGYAKRNLQLASYYANKQYGLNAVCICPTTLYGPGDSFDENRTKVMGGLIKKFLKAKQEGSPYVECWGTGEPLREFLYVEDAAKYAALSLLKYDDSSMPLNIGSGQEVSIKELAQMIAKAVEYSGEIKWDTSKADGQYRKRLDLTRQKSIIGDIALVSLEDGIKRTVDWCVAEKIV